MEGLGHKWNKPFIEIGADRVVDIKREVLSSIFMEMTQGYWVGLPFKCASVADFLKNGKTGKHREGGDEGKE